MRRNPLPLWFRAALVLSFAVLLVPFLLLRDPGIADAFARSIVERMAPRIRPALETQAALSRVTDPQSFHGAYYLNGMLVQYQTYRARATAAEVIQRCERAFREAGYQTKRVLVQGQPTLVGIHPQTKMMLTVRPVGNYRGMLTVRLSQQDLAQMRDDFRAELPGFPKYPGASGNTLISSAEGPLSRNLTFVVPASSTTIADFYRSEMSSRGWSPLPPLGSGGSDLRLLFFEKDGVDCSVMLMPIGQAGQTLAMVSING